MFKIKKYIVKPLSSKKENFYLLIVFILLISLAAITLRIRYKSEYNQIIANDEISAFTDLNNIESSIYSDILNSIIDISLLINQSNNPNFLPAIKDLEIEEIPPYYRDKIWEQKGAINWFNFFHDDKMHYLGISSKDDIGSFLLVINENSIEESDIFFTEKKLVQEEVLKNWDYYKKLFKKIIPYTGEEQRKNY